MVPRFREGDGDRLATSGQTARTYHGVDAGAGCGPRTILGDGSSTDVGAAGLTGYSIVSTADIVAASDLAKGCPLLTGGGTVEVYETVPR